MTRALWLLIVTAQKDKIIMIMNDKIIKELARSVSEQHAFKSIRASVICFAITLSLNYIPLDRLTSSLINWLVFIPIFFYAVYHSVLALFRWIIKRDKLRWQFLLMTPPPIVYFFGFIVKVFFLHP